MAAKGFIKLLEIAERSRQRSVGVMGSGLSDDYWSGVGFTLDGRHYLAAMGEVAEVLSVPRYTSVPGVKSWMKGVANVRGRLLPIMDMLTYLNGASALPEHRRRLLVIDQGDIFSGLLVDDVLGMQHFAVRDYQPVAETVPSDVAPFAQGVFRRDEREWVIFSLSRLVEDPKFLQAANG